MKRGYRNNEMLVGALEKTVEEVGNTGFYCCRCQAQSEKFRNTYNQELQKIEKSRKSGMGREDLYTPPLKWFHLMDTFKRKTKGKKIVTK